MFFYFVLMEGEDMILEQELVALCKETMDILYELKEKGIISEEELNLHLTEKKKIIEKLSREIKND